MYGKFPLKLMALCAFIGLVSTIVLVISELNTPGYCPKIFSVPACYIVCIAFSFVISSYFIDNITVNYLSFIVGATIGFVVAIWFSYTQLYAIQDCPHIYEIPLCYVSFFLFSVIIALKLLYEKN
jgi:hypothetical protein